LIALILRGSFICLGFSHGVLRLLISLSGPRRTCSVQAPWRGHNILCKHFIKEMGYASGFDAAVAR
jgi:hypothetical protein